MDLSVEMVRSFRNWKRISVDRAGTSSRSSGVPIGDELLSRDKDNILKKTMMETVDGEYQIYKAKDGAYVREHFFGKDPRLLKMVENMSDDEIWRLSRGGHDPQKVYAAFKVAQEHTGQPTVILCQTVKGYAWARPARR